MECLLNIYDTDLDGFKENSCFVSDDNENARYVAITSPKGAFNASHPTTPVPLTFVLNAKADGRIQGAKCVISSVLYKLLGLQYGAALSSVYLTAEPVPVEAVTLAYLGYYSAFHWDEYPHDDPRQCPNQLVSTWPSGVSVAAYTRLLPSLLMDWVFVSNQEGSMRGGLVVPALSVHMVTLNHILKL